MKKKSMLLFFILIVTAAAVFAAYYFADRPDESQNSTINSVSQTTAHVFKYQKYIDKNKDFVGYIEIDGTHISYPVAQTSDNSFYLSHNFDKKEDERGAVYMAAECNSDKLDFNTVLYGHNWLDTTMFSELTKYKDIDFYRQHPIVKFNSAFDDREWKIFAAFISNADEREDNGYIFNYIYPHMNGGNFDGYIKEVQKRALYRTAVEVKESDKILTLSTCIRDMDTVDYRADARIVIVARLVRDGEGRDVDVSAAKINPSPKYPQRYCDIMGIENVYANDAYWYPYESE